MPDETARLRRLSHEDATLEQLIYWSRKTLSEQLAGAEALTKRLYQMRGTKWDNQRQVAILAALLENKVEFVVVGGLAVNAHGYVRGTGDLDLFVSSTEQNVNQAYDAFRAVGVANNIDIVLVGEEPSLRVYPADEDHVDILPWIGGITFDQVWRNRIEAQTDGLPISFISKSDLIENKRQTGRLRDLADVEELTRIPDPATCV